MQFPALGRLPDAAAVRDSARRFFVTLFRTSTGQVRMTRAGRTWTIALRVEGVDAHDPEVQGVVRRQFTRDFVQRGLRPARLVEMTVGLLSGSREDGTPPDHLIVLPPISLES